MAELRLGRVDFFLRHNAVAIGVETAEALERAIDEVGLADADVGLVRSVVAAVAPRPATLARKLVAGELAVLVGIKLVEAGFGARLGLGAALPSPLVSMALKRSPCPP
ncbi:MAG: hypothetical protein U1E87_09585 [Alphaproteobacteria bacterium]